MNATNEQVKVTYRSGKGSGTQTIPLIEAAAWLQGWGYYDTTEQAKDAILANRLIATKLGTVFQLETR